RCRVPPSIAVRCTLDLRAHKHEAAVVSDIKQQVETWLLEAAVSALGEPGRVDPLVRPAKGDRFGDYQANLAMSLGKALGKAPRDVANAIADALREGPTREHFEKIEVAGPGFINLTLERATLEDFLNQMSQSPRLGVNPAQEPQTV